MKRKSFEGAECPIARSLDEIGDWWTLLIVRDALHGSRRFGEFQKSLGISKNILTGRLTKLVANGVLELRPGEGDSAYTEYHLTDKGRRLRMVLIALRQWGEHSLYETGEPMTIMRDRVNGAPVRPLELVANDGRVLDHDDTIVMPGRFKRQKQRR